MKPVPYYDQDSITIYHGDCAQVLPFLDPVDLLLTDPPYGIGIGKDGRIGGGCHHTKWSDGIAWDDAPPCRELIDSCIGKASKAILWGGNYFGLGPTKTFFIWDKVQRGLDFADAEVAWANTGGPVRVFTRARSPALYKDRQHPTQKPIDLIHWCIQQAGDGINTILDPFMGSGTTLVAAKNQGKRCIGIEREEKYCKIAVERLGQQSLFQQSNVNDHRGAGEQL